MTRTRKLPTVEELARHVRQLSSAFKIQLQEDPSLPMHGAKAGLEVRVDDRKLIIEGSQRRMIIIHPVTHPTLYAVAMHELGHLLHPSGMLQDWHGPMNWLLKITEEESAWEWAHQNALDWSPEMQQVEDMSLKGYREQHEAVKNFQPALQTLNKMVEEELRRQRQRAEQDRRLLEDAKRRIKTPPRPLKDLFK